MSIPSDDNVTNSSHESSGSDEVDLGGRVYFDFYGAKALVQLDDPEAVEGNQQHLQRHASEVWADCIIQLQRFTVSLMQLLAELPTTCVRVLKSIGTASESIGEFTRRVARGRAKADHHEDERIAEASELGPPAETAESQALREASLDRLKRWTSTLQARGLNPKIIVTPEGKLIVTAVPEVAERDAIERAQAKLTEPQYELHLAISIDLFGLPTRLVRVLNEAGIDTIEQLGMLTVADVSSIAGIGKAYIEKLKPFLAPSRID